jgi:bifunctional non-homologous end joining protein LigD
LALMENGTLKYVGKAGSGFNDDTLTEVSERLAELDRIKRPVKEKPDDDAQSVWLEPKLFCEVQYASVTKDGILREPVFLRLRPDLTPEV